jgi:ABC-type nitrate/sulfonate/bicarbonate transport system substrate-binding protein
MDRRSNRSKAGAHRWRLAGVLISWLAVALLAASCGGQEGTGAGGGEPTEVVVGGAANISEGPLFVADRAGFDKKHGVDLNVQLFDLGYQGVEAAMAGRTQGGVSVEFPMLLLLDKLQGAERVVAPAVIQTSRGLKIVVNADIEKPADLAGKSIGLPVGSSLDYGFQRYLEKFNVDRNSVKLVNVGPPEMIATLDRGDIDGFVFADPVVSQALDRFGDEVHMMDPGLDAAYTTRVWLQFAREWAEQNPKAVQGVLAAINDANTLLQDDPEKAYSLIGQQLAQPTDEVREAMERGDYTWDVYVDDESIEAFDDVATWMADNDVIKEKPDYRRAIDTSYLEAVAPDQVKVSK